MRKLILISAFCRSASLDCAPDCTQPEKAQPDRRAVWHLLVMRGFIIVAVMFWLALSYQNNHRDFGPAKVETVR